MASDQVIYDFDGHHVAFTRWTSDVYALDDDGALYSCCAGLFAAEGRE